MSYTLGETLVITWHPELFFVIGSEVLASKSHPFYIAENLSLAWFKEKYPTWAKWANLEYLEVNQGDGLHFSYPTQWMQRKYGFDMVYPIVKEKNILTI